MQVLNLNVRSHGPSEYFREQYFGMNWWDPHSVGRIYIIHEHDYPEHPGVSPAGIEVVTNSYEYFVGFWDENGILIAYTVTERNPAEYFPFPEPWKDGQFLADYDPSKDF